MTRRTVVFDVGGVIVRWQPMDLMRAHLPQVPPDEAYKQLFQGWAPNADWLDFDLGRVAPDELSERIARRTGYPLAAVASLVAAVPDHLQPMPESLALIERLRDAGYRLAVLSNMPAPYADHLEREHQVFDAFELRAWSGRLGLAKPQRAIFEHLHGALGIADPAHALFLDDHPTNVEAARAFGWHALQFDNAASVTRQLAGLGWLSQA